MRRDRSWKYRIGKRGSAGVQALETAWEMLRATVDGVPRAVLTFVDSRSRGFVHGYFARSIWKKRRGAVHEIAINPRLIGQPSELLGTMVHEAAHAILYEAGENGGMGSTGYYHTTRFRDECKALGLTCEFWNTRYGWTVTAWSASGVPEKYRPILAHLRQELPAGIGGRVALKQKGRRLPVSGHTMLVCGCEEGDRTIYVKKSVLKQGGVMCSLCGEDFRPPTG